MDIAAMMSAIQAPTSITTNPNARDNVVAMDINNWPGHIADLSMATKMILIDPNDCEGLFDQHSEVIEKYIKIVDEELAGVPHFIKLNSRSPKDASYPEAPICDNGGHAIDLIVNSMRCLDDMAMMHMADQDCFIVLRKLVPISLDRELRCYAKDGVLVGASRYDYGNTADEFWTSPEADKLLEEAQSFYDRHIKADYPTVVFDLALGLGEYALAGPVEQHLLIELNPYGLSDPCVFKSYANLEATGGLAR